VNTRLLVALAVALSMSAVAHLLLPLISIVIPYFSFVLLFAVWGPSKKVILILSGLNILVMYFSILKNYFLCEALINFTASISRVSPHHIWISLIYWVSPLTLIEVLTAYYTAKELKIMERIGYN